MKLRISLLVLLLAASSAFADTLFMEPLTATANVGGAPITFEAACNKTPCTITWSQVLSNSEVGTLSKCGTCSDTTPGPVTIFTPGTSPGTVMVVVTDGKGNYKTATINVGP